MDQRQRPMEDLVNPAFWRGRRVFLTGHTGFKGSWLSLWLQSLGAEVHGYALSPETTPALFEVADVARGRCRAAGRALVYARSLDSDRAADASFDAAQRGN